MTERTNRGTGKGKSTTGGRSDRGGTGRGAARGSQKDDRGSKGRSSGPAKGPKDRPEEEGPERHSSRAGKRPPASGRAKKAEGAGPYKSKGDQGRPVKRKSDGTTDERPSQRGPQKDRSRAVRDTRSGGRNLGRGQDRNSKRGRMAEEGSDDGLIRLNRYLAHSGVASRREADDLIKAGVVAVNGVIVTELGTKVSPTDRVHYGGQRLTTEKKRYVLLNKPKNFITTTDDPRDRRTVMALIDDACTERLYPVGRLDRHTTGVLLMTNDGDLAKKLTHPSFGAEKIYYATLDKNITKADIEKLVSGVDLDDGIATADEASYVVNGTKKEVGLKIHMGRNRIVRRMFEALGYTVEKLDRVVFAGLTKKDLPRGKWRHLSDKEVLFLSKRK